MYYTIAFWRLYRYIRYTQVFHQNRQLSRNAWWSEDHPFDINGYGLLGTLNQKALRREPPFATPQNSWYGFSLSKHATGISACADLYLKSLLGTLRRRKLNSSPFALPARRICRRRFQRKRHTACHLEPQPPMELRRRQHRYKELTGLVAIAVYTHAIKACE